MYKGTIIAIKQHFLTAKAPLHLQEHQNGLTLIKEKGDTKFVV